MQPLVFFKKTTSLIFVNLKKKKKSSETQYPIKSRSLLIEKKKKKNCENVLKSQLSNSFKVKNPKGTEKIKKNQDDINYYVINYGSKMMGPSEELLKIHQDN